MRRRRLLAGIALAGSVAGCTAPTGGGSSPTDEDTPTDESTPTESDTPTETDDESNGGTPTETDGDSTDAFELTDQSFERLSDCSASDADTATVTAGGGETTIEGCIQGRNGCMMASLADVRADGGEMTVVVETVQEGEVCSQQLVYRGYRATITHEGHPTTVTVVHRSMNDERTVTTADATES